MRKCPCSSGRDRCFRSSWTRESKTASRTWEPCTTTSNSSSTTDEYTVQASSCKSNISSIHWKPFVSINLIVTFRTRISILFCNNHFCKAKTVPYYSRVKRAQARRKPWPVSKNSSLLFCSPMGNTFHSDSLKSIAKNAMTYSTHGNCVR